MTFLSPTTGSKWQQDVASSLRAPPGVLPTRDTSHDTSSQNVGSTSKLECLSPIFAAGDDPLGGTSALTPHMTDDDQLQPDVTHHSSRHAEVMQQSPTTMGDVICEQDEECSQDDNYSDTSSTLSSPALARSHREEQIARTQQELGESNKAFIEGIRGAALKRKLQMQRSRDSLVAKTIAVHRHNDSHRTVGKEPVEETMTFKAKPMPMHGTELGTGGLVGVPKVAKKPTTTPFSPLLGARRYMSKTIVRRRNKSDKENNDGLFRARDLPSTTSELNSAGLAGVPKVTKRHTTTPFSPLLGGRRPKTTPNLKPRRELTTVQESSPVGLDYLSMSASVAPASCAFVLHSTERAEARRKFDQYLAQRKQVEYEAAQRARWLEIRRLEQELKQLRTGL